MTDCEDKYVITAENFNVVVSTENTKSLVIPRNQIETSWKLKEIIIKQVVDFQYVGADGSIDTNTCK